MRSSAGLISFRFSEARLTTDAVAAAAPGSFFSSGRLRMRCFGNRRSRWPGGSSTRSCPVSMPWRSEAGTIPSGFAAAFPTHSQPGVTRRAPAGASTSFVRTWSATSRSFGVRVPAETLRRFLTMLAHHQGGLLNASELARSLGVSVPAVTRYVDLLSDLMLVRRLSAYFVNVGKRLVKSPKVYIRDSGILHALLGLSTLDGRALASGGGDELGRVRDREPDRRRTFRDRRLVLSHAGWGGDRPAAATAGTAGCGQLRSNEARHPRRPEALNSPPRISGRRSGSWSTRVASRFRYPRLRPRYR